jgi:hypothetical protein
MPKTIYLTGDDDSYLSTCSGIDITWTKSTQRLYIGGWYDGCVGIESKSLTLKEFFDKLGITEKDIKKALKKINI